MDLINDTIRAAFETHPVNSQSLPPDAPVLVKYFDPCGRGTWFVFQAEPWDDDRNREDWRLYNWCVSPLGPDCDEWGYVLLSELQDTKNVLGLHMERDLHFEGRTLLDVKGAPA